ncbi:hypothetical protein [Pseudodonghicola flavimaris]|uniref:Uncharacterized protein n=1 Tax=Pseudodonghicola flavimaris TaxID=3050036 RepID=A0ABT7EWK9_9RHOB|nr:hypothetical protein [Pseudodonghicola flavimaris]MDK3016736.1 hypothetical protein [Pseudodonghicola flavimaris]
MSASEQVMIVLMGPAEVRQTFRDWPADMCLAVCLMESGDCQLVVFRHDEVAAFPRRLQRQLGVAADALCFFPAVTGYATRPLLYSDERRLMALVAEAPEIVEEAADYSVNYAYALDEGLDPAVFLGVETPVPPAPETGADAPDGARTAARPVPVAHLDADGHASFVTRRTRPLPPQSSGRVRKALLPGFMQKPEAPGPGPHFRSARELDVVADQPVICDLLPEHDGWILIAQHGQGGADIRIGNPDLIYLRDDRSVVAIRLEPPWPGGGPLPGRIWIRTDRLPQSLRGVFADCTGAAELTGTGDFLYLHLRPRALQAGGPRPPAPFDPMPVAAEPVTAADALAEPAGADAPGGIGEGEASAVMAPKPVVVAPKAEAPLSAPRKRLRRRWLAAVSAAASVLILVQIGLQLGGEGALTRDWGLLRSDWQAARAD